MTREALKLALEALERADKISGYPNNKKVINALRTAIEAAEKQEPDELTIAYMSGLYDGKKHTKQREWVGLTDEELDEAEIEGGKSYRRWASRIRGQMLSQQDSLQWHVSRAIEAKLKEKNT